MRVENVIKEKAIVTILLENDKKIIVDFGNKKIISYTGRTVKRISVELEYSETLNKYAPLFWAIRRDYFLSCPQKMEALESLWNVLEFVCYDDIPEENPKGFVKYALENGFRISNDRLYIYKLNLLEKSIPQKYLEDWSFLCSRFYFLQSIRLQFDVETIIKIVKVFNNSLKNKKRCFCLQSDMETFLLWAKDKLFCDIIDTTRDAAYNNDIYQVYKRKVLADNVLKKESKILPLEKIQHEKFCIVVPKSLQDFIDEGEQQRNCVGYYYHNSIASGENLIYFVRLKENPKKSLNTCRYAVFLQRTVENRIYRNEDSSKEVTRFIKNIVDPAIKEILSK